MGDAGDDCSTVATGASGYSSEMMTGYWLNHSSPMTERHVVLSFPDGAVLLLNWSLALSCS